jgi:ATP-dependent DNA helicase RecQ
MAFLQHRLDDPSAVPCGRCDNCAGAWYPRETAEADAASVDSALAKVGVLIEPRAQWPSGMAALGVAVSGKIPVDDRVEPGRALARLTDLGWGGPLRELFAPGAADTEAPVAMMQACFQVLADWGWEARPVAIVTVPSRSRPQLVASVAAAISRVGRLPIIGELDTVGGGPTGNAGNSAYRLAGVHERFMVGEQLADGLAAVAGHPILLIDDVVDSRWTITEAGRLLRANGAAAVLPFALALRA